MSTSFRRKRLIKRDNKYHDNADTPRQERYGYVGGARDVPWYGRTDVQLGATTLNIVIATVGLVGPVLRLLKREKTVEKRIEHAGLSGVVPYSALKIAAWRAIESELGAKALFNDPLASELAGYQAVSDARRRAETALSGAPSRIAIRTRYFDDKLLEALAGPPATQDSVMTYLLSALSSGPKPISQIVLLGAGMDTRIFRLRSKFTADTAFEVDLQEVLDAKQKVLDNCSAAGTLPELSLAKRRVVVGADFSSPRWFEALVRAGFQKDVPTVWLAEGLLMYLEPDEVTALSKTVFDLSASNSMLLVSMVNEVAVIKAKASESELMKTWKWGANDPKGFFTKQGWDVRSVVQIGSKEAAYGRWTGPEPTDMDADTTSGRTLYITASKP